MTVFTEGHHAAEFIVWEEEANFSRDAATVLMGQVLVAGQVVGMDSAGKWKSSDPGAADGSEVAKGIVLYPVDATAADVDTTVISRQAVVNKNLITFDASINTDPLRAAKVAELLAVGIKVQ